MSKTATKKRNKATRPTKPNLQAPWEDDDEYYSETLDRMMGEIEASKTLEEAVAIAYVYSTTDDQNLSKQLIDALNTKRQKTILRKRTILYGLD